MTAWTRIVIRFQRWIVRRSAKKIAAYYCRIAKEHTEQMAGLLQYEDKLNQLIILDLPKARVAAHDATDEALEDCRGLDQWNRESTADMGLLIDYETWREEYIDGLKAELHEAELDCLESMLEQQAVMTG